MSPCGPSSTIRARRLPRRFGESGRFLQDFKGAFARPMTRSTELRILRSWRRWAGVVLATTGLSACGFADQALIPTLTGEAPAQPAAQTAAKALSPEEQVESLVARLGRLQGQTREHFEAHAEQQTAVQLAAGGYDTLVGEILAALEGGAGPEDPALTEKWLAAQGSLREVKGALIGLNHLLDRSSATANNASVLSGAAKDALDSGDLGEANAGQLLFVRDEAERVAGNNRRLLESLTEDVSRSQAFYSGEQINLNDLRLRIQQGV